MAHVGALVCGSSGGEDALSNFFAMSSDPLWKRLRNFDWSPANLSLSESKEVQKLLQDLAGKKEARAMRASQRLWSYLKGNSGLVPLIRPFLYEIRLISDPAIQSEIDDLLKLA